jgi:hypothetical protein
MKVFKRGLFIIIDNGEEHFVPVGSLYYRVYNDETTLVNYDKPKAVFTAAVSAIQNEAGSTVGNAVAVAAYLQGLTESDSGVANSPSQQRLTDPSSVTIASWKTLSFVCSGTITVTIDGNAIVYPFDIGSTVLGASYAADTVTANSVLFNGTGTVLVTTQS